MQMFHVALVTQATKHKYYNSNTSNTRNYLAVNNILLFFFSLLSRRPLSCISCRFQNINSDQYLNLILGITDNTDFIAIQQHHVHVFVYCDIVILLHIFIYKSLLHAVAARELLLHIAI